MVETITAITGIAGLLGKTASFINDAAVTDEGFVRAYYLEVSRNIEILKTVDIPALKNEELTSPVFKSLIFSLNTEIGAALLCSDIKKRKNLLSFLGQGLVIQMPEGSPLPLETGDDGEAGPGPVSSLSIDVLKAVWFTVQKTELLKALTALDNGLFRQGFCLNVRLANIFERFRHIRQKLAENKAMAFLQAA